MDQTGALESAGPAARPRRPAHALVLAGAALLKGLAPWVLLVGVWEWAAAVGWSGATLFPPPSEFLRYAIESDFRIGFGNEAMTIPVAIVASALRVLAGLAIGFGAAIAPRMPHSMRR